MEQPGDEAEWLVGAENGLEEIARTLEFAVVERASFLSTCQHWYVNYAEPQFYQVHHNTHHKVLASVSVTKHRTWVSDGGKLITDDSSDRDAV